jgi:hypothetical protein
MAKAAPRGVSECPYAHTTTSASPASIAMAAVWTMPTGVAPPRSIVQLKLAEISSSAAIRAAQP